MFFLNLICLIQILATTKKQRNSFLNDHQVKMDPNTKYFTTCPNMYVEIDNGCYIKCSGASVGSFSNLYFEVSKSLEIENRLENYDDALEKMIGVTEHFYNFSNVEIRFTNFWNTSYALQYLNHLVNKSLFFHGALIYPEWEKYLLSTKYCPWDECEFNSQYDYIKEYFDTNISNSNWRKICIDTSGILVFDENSKGQLVVIPTVSSMVIIICVIVLIVVIILSLLAIACCRKKRIQDDGSLDSI